MKEALYYEKIGDGSVQCRLCPHNCRIAPGRRGICRGRVNHDGTLYSEIYARVTSVALDPIEKKPLYHFHPGSTIYSMGTVGCNFACQFCQNWQISQVEADTEELPPAVAVEQAIGAGSVGIAYTYNEPSIWIEYVLDTAKLAHARGLKNVLVTNGYISPEPLRDVLNYIDALNIDIKSMEDEFYQKLCKARLQPVLDATKLANERALVEVTNLVIPGWNDKDEHFARLRDWIAAELGPDTPTHLSAYFPRYKLKAPPTPVSTLQRAYEVCREKLHFVYLGNVGGRTGADTLCKNCGSTLVRRVGYSTEVVGLRGGKCSNCGTDNRFVV